MIEFKAKLAVKPGAKPVFVRPRPVPFALREPLEKELDRLEEAGVIEKVAHSDWAAPIVAIPKSDGTLEITRSQLTSSSMWMPIHYQNQKT